MRTLLTLSIAACLAVPGLAQAYCTPEYLSDEDLSIMASVLPAPEKPAQICYLPVHSSDLQLSTDAGWEPVLKPVNCLAVVDPNQG